MSSDSEGDNTSIYIYNGVGEVPEDVTHVRVDPSITVIPTSAFQRRRQLEVVELPEGLIQIGESAFSSCISLKRINLPCTLEEIGKEAFNHCEKLKGVNLPERLQRLGRWAFITCQSLKSINIPPNIKTIQRGVFFGCHSLAEVILSGGIEVIEKDTFHGCKSLVSVTFPSSLRVIGEGAFEYCSTLNEIHIPNTIASIGARAFKDCNFTNFRLPPMLTDLYMSILGDKNSTVSFELSENVTHIQCGNQTQTTSCLRNIALPSECTVTSLGWCTDLKLAFIENDYDTMIDALKHRFDDFDNLPIHKICYYQSYHENETIMQHLKRQMSELNVSAKEQDCLGMTPLHILACSTKPTIEMYRLLIHKCPETLVMKDKWGDIPLLYAIWCNAPVAVIDLLVESYKSFHPDYEFDWNGMMETLAKRNVPLANIQKLVNTQRSNFPDQEYDFQQVQDIVLQLAAFERRGLEVNAPSTPIETFRYLLRFSITKRLDSLDIAKWRIDFDNCIKKLPYYAADRDRRTRAIYDRLATYESIKEGTSVLELALWKAKIDEGRNKRARTDTDMSYKDHCRINCGADIIIRNVLPYLLPKKLELEFEE